MHNQSSQNTSSSSSGPSISGQASQVYQDVRSPYPPVYNQATKTPIRDGNSSGPAIYNGSNMQSQRSKFASKSAAPLAVSSPLAVNSNLDWSAANRAAYNGPLVIVPPLNPPNYFGGYSQMPSFVTSPITGQADQVSQFPYVQTNLYQSLGSMIPGPYSFPYVVNYDSQDNKQSVWSQIDQKGAQNENAGFNQYYPTPYVSTLDGASFSGYSYANMLPQVGPLSVPFQMMKTTNGYVVQDLDIITQQDPAIPRAVPAMWTNPSELTLAKCLENREGITNVYIRGFLPETTDDMLYAYAVRFGKIERCKAIVDLDTGLCKGFGFVQYYSFESCENCIRGFFYLGYQASFAQKSRNSRLKDLEDRASTNIYCTNIPIDWTEADLRRHFEPYRVVSEKISRDDKTGVSKEVGFARFESREIAERVLGEFHNNTVTENNVKLLLRFADTKAQKMLKQQSNERRAYRAGEYNYSVEVVQNTPSPSMQRIQQVGPLLTPNSQKSMVSPTGPESWTPATTVSPTFAMIGDSNSARNNSISSRSLNALESTPVDRRRHFANRRSMTDISAGSSKTVVPESPTLETRSYMSSPQKENIKAGSMSPFPSRLETMTPASVV